VNTIRPIEVKTLPGFHLWLKFSDGTQGELDLSFLKGKGVFSYWEKKGNFETAYIDKETNSISWTDEIELDSFNMYLKLIGKSFEEWKAAQLEHA